MIKKFTKNNRGFTLLEVLTAIGIFSVASLGVLGLLLTNIRGVMEVENRLVATNLARGKLDELLSVRNNNWATGSDFMQGIETTEPIPLCQDNRGFYLEDIDNNQSCRASTHFSMQVLVGDCEDLDSDDANDVCLVTTRVHWGTTYAEITMRLYDWGGPDAVPQPATPPQGST